MAKINKEQQTKDEMKILAEFQQNSNRNIDTIAKRCGFSKQKVRRAIKRMEENHIIWGYTAVADNQKLGFEKFILLIKRSTKEIGEETADQLASYRLNKDVLELGMIVETSYFTHGEYDWVLIFMAKDLKHALKLSNLLLSKYTEMVSKFELIQILITLRSQFILNPDYMKLRELL